MGLNSSKESNTKVWTGSSAPGVSQNLLHALQSSPESDASRLQAVELEIQARVAAELKRLREQEAEALREAQAKIQQEQQEKQGQDDSSSGTSRFAVAKEVEALRAKLEERRQVRQLPEAVEAARGEVVRCLRENDRRPLDCWQEVERFKEEVRRLEKGWVDKVVA